MFTQASKTTNSHHDISEKHDNPQRVDNSSTNKGLPSGFLQSPENILQLQKTIGNRAVMQLLKFHFSQPLQSRQFREWSRVIRFK
ncbi:MAG: hypothetical protein A4E55_01938 [Pelotomaculum sp. PtaU1.Bin035]|nr:MAG: hypothetical protein A4E55_01938 [Pelotomaculum sp. PtaU1.Bin035]